VVPRQILRILVFLLPVFVVAFGVLMGGAMLAGATRDAPAATALRWVAMAVLMLGVIDTILLVGALGLKALEDSDRQRESDRSRE
jgi:hypothetical protein